MNHLNLFSKAMVVSTVVFSHSFVNSQTTVVIQPNASAGKDAIILDCVPCGFYSTNYGNYDEISAIAWTYNGNISNSRGLFEFDFSGIPQNASVINAKLSLYHNGNPASGNMNGQHSTTSGSNASYLRRVTASWSESTVSWANQPAVTTVNQILLPASTSGSQDYLDIDVSSMVQDMIANPAQNFGFMLQLATESHYRGLIFASSDHSNSALHPKLEITYLVPDPQVDTCVTFRPDGAKGIDAIIASCIPCGFYNTNHGDYDEISAIAWTYGGNESEIRGLIEFNMSNIPSSATVSDAKLSLYQNPNPASGNMNGQHSTLSGSNQSYLRKITSAWNEHLVTWANQPSTTTSGQVVLAASTSGTEDYPDIDVTNLVQGMVTTPAQNFGFMLQLATETHYRGLLFASSDHSNPLLRPKLEVCYSIPTNGLIEYKEKNQALEIWPNPGSGKFHVAVPFDIVQGRMKIVDASGKVVYEDAFSGDTQFVDADLTAGVYIVFVGDSQNTYSGRVQVQY